MHERCRLKQKPEPVEFVGRVVSQGAKNAPQFRLSFFLGDCFRRQTEDKLASVVGAQTDSVTVGERSGLGQFAVDEDALALTTILNQEPGGACGNGRALARDALVVE